MARFAVALALMLVAVLPHATLAASSGLHMKHEMAAPMAHEAGVGHAGHAAAQAGAHSHSKPSPDAPAMPACCILGCGLIASAPDIRAAMPAPAWLIRAALPAIHGPGRTTEPAERPPRPAAATTRTT